MSHDGERGPAKPLRLASALERTGDELRLRCRSREWAGGLFMLLWLTAWTVGCVFLAGMVLRDPKPFSLLFAMPFWLSWLFVFCMLLRMFFQREELRLDGEGAAYTRTVLVPLRKRQVPLAEIQSFEPYSAVIDNESGRSQPGIEIRTLGIPIRIGQGLSDRELDWLRHQLQEHLEHLRQGGRSAQPAGEPDGVGHTSDEVTALVLAPARDRVMPPSDCAWTRADGFDDLCFVKRGRVSLGTLLSMGFVALFWNGIVSVFVVALWGLAPGEVQPQGVEWWGLFVFLIPFEVIGLVILLAWLSALVEPVHRTCWRFTRWGIELRHTWLALGPRWTWQVDALDRIELHRLDQSRPSARRGAVRGLAGGGGDGRNHWLSLVDRENAEFCSITGLTEGEARWMGDVLLKDRAMWFGSRGDSPRG